MLEQFCIDQSTSSLVQRSVDGYDITLRNKVFQVFNTTGVDIFGGLFEILLVVLFVGANIETYFLEVAHSRSTKAPCSQMAPNAEAL